MKAPESLSAVILLIFISLISCDTKKREAGKTNEDSNIADVVIYGGTSAGISAAIQTAKLNKSVILIEPTKGMWKLMLNLLSL
jgi:heterodisulfide reductase subunit A-like polyferredoxin